MDLTECFTNDDSSDATNTVESITVPLSDDDRDFIVSQAGDRNASYDEGKTTNEIFGDDGDSASKHEVGFAGELAIAGLYESASVDLSVSASGDGGIDTEMLIDGETRSVDVKSATYNGPNASIMVHKGHADRSSTVLPDCYVSCWVADDLSKVEIRGWAYSDEVIQESNLKDSPVGDWTNYAVSCDDLRDMEEPTGGKLIEGEDYYVVR